jgi:hypothetical protein
VSACIGREYYNLGSSAALPLTCPLTNGSTLCVRGVYTATPGTQLIAYFYNAVNINVALQVGIRYMECFFFFFTILCKAIGSPFSQFFSQSTQTLPM